MNRILKPVRRFWRGLSGRLRAALILLLVLALSLAAFGVYLLVKPEEEETPSLNKLEPLFTEIGRETLEKIYLYPKDGTPYSVERYLYENNGVETAGFKLFIDGEDYGKLSLNSTVLSSLIVGAGQNLVYDTVLTAPAADDPEYEAKMAIYEQKLIEYKLTDDAPSYVIETVSEERYRVYYGTKSPTGSSYYMRLEGRDTVYIGAGSDMGDFLNAAGPETLVAPLFFLPSNMEQAYAYPGLFGIAHRTRYEREHYPDTVITSSDTVGYTVREADGTLRKRDVGLSLDNVPEAFSAFVGQRLGVCDMTLNVTVEDETYVFHVVSLDYVERESKLFEAAFVNPSQRSILHSYSIYKFTMDGITKYLPDTNEMMTALEKTYALTGTVVHIDTSVGGDSVGLSNEVIDKYGLYRYTVEMNYPYFDLENMYVKDEKGNDTKDFAPLYQIPGLIYVSDETERGTRYVGSMLYGTVCEVDAASLSFLDLAFYDWVEPDMVLGGIYDISRVYMNWNYGDGKWMNAAYNISVTLGTATNYDGSAYTTIASASASLAGGEGPASIVLDPKIYTQFFYRLYYIDYKGGHGLSDDEVAAYLADESLAVMQMNISYTDDVVSTYRFIPISSDRVLVAVGGTNSPGLSAYFVIYGTALKDLARGYISMMEGEAFNHENRY